MATEKYVCRKCEWVTEFDSRRKNHPCPICGKEMDYLFDVGVLGKRYFRENLDSSIVSYTVPEGIESIEEDAFQYENGLKTVILPTTLNSIGSNAFNGSKGLTLVNIPENVKSIYMAAFRWTNMAHVYLPETLTYIANDSFSDYPAMPMFHVVKNSYAHKYAIDNNLKFKLHKTISGAAIKDDVVIADGIECVPGHVLENTDVKTLRISSTVKTIEEYAFADCKSLTKIDLQEGLTRIGEGAFLSTDKTDKVDTIVIPSSVVEIGKNAFAGRIFKHIEFKPGIKKIASGAFSDAAIVKIDLPDTVEEVAPEAFGKNTIVSIGGKISVILSKNAENEAADNAEQKTIDDLKEKIKESTALYEEKKTWIGNFEILIHDNEALLDEEQKKLEEYSRAYDEVTISETDLKARLASSLAEMNTELTKLRTEADSLRADLSHTFFLNVSKRNEIKSKIEAKENEIREQEERIRKATDILNTKVKSAEQLTTNAKNEKSKSENHCSELEKNLSEFKTRKSELEIEASGLSDALSELQNELERAENEHKENSDKREQELKKLEADIKAKQEKIEKKIAEEKAKKEREEYIKKIEVEKAKIIAVFDVEKLPKETVVFTDWSGSTADNALINDEYVKFINFLSEQSRCKFAKSITNNNKKLLARLSDINRELSKEEYDGIDPVFIKDAPNDYDFLPDRAAELHKLLSGKNMWKQLKKILKNYESNHDYKRIIGDRDLHIKFLERAGGIPICWFENLWNTADAADENCILLFLPYCIIELGNDGEMLQYLYNEASVSFDYQTFESEEECNGYEEIGNRYLHENKDGTKSLRFSHNPLIHIYKKPILCIELLDVQFSKVVCNGIEQLAESLKTYIEFLTTAPYKDAYDAIKEFKPVEVIKKKIEEADFEYMRRQNAEKKRRAAETKAQKAAEKREEEERLAKLKAAEQEAEEKRKALIEKQRERNKEKRFDEIETSESDAANAFVSVKENNEEKRAETTAALSIVSSVANIIQSADFSGNIASEKGLILSDKNRTVHNNIFSLNFVLKGDEYVRNVFMADRFGNVISNVKDITAKNGEKTRVTLTLRQTDFDKNGKYYLAVTDGKGGVESLTEFKIDIAFSNDFEDDFGSSFGFENLDNSEADDKVEKTDIIIPEKADSIVSAEKANDIERSQKKTDQNPKEDNKMDLSCKVDSISQWKVDEKLISIPKNAVTLPDNTYFIRLDYSVVEIPKSIWDSDDIDKKYMKDPKDIPDYQKSADIVFKVIFPDDTYYYAYLSYQECYGEYNYYRQTPDDEKYYNDNNIEQELLRRYNTDFNQKVKVMARLCRIATPYKLDEELYIKFVSYVKKYAFKVIEFIAGFDCPELLETLYRIGALKKEQNGAVLEALKKEKANKCIADFDTISSVEVIKLEKTETQKKPARTKGTVLSFTSDFCADHPGLALKKSTKRTPVQVTLSTGKKFTYLCRFPVSNGDQVIIGNGYQSWEPSKNSGFSGNVTDCEYATAPKKAYAVEISFAFSKNAQNIDLKECGKMFEAPSADEINANNFGYYGKLYPITYEVRRMLSALTVLDYIDYAEFYTNSAKLFINSRHIISGDIEKLLDKSNEISISDMKSSRLQMISDAFASTVKGAKDGFIAWEKLQKSKDAFNDFFNQYVLFGTADIIIRCDLDNLLKVYLENCREINEHRDTLIEMAKELGAKKCLDLLNQN